MSGRRRRFALVAGGGTAGHVVPAVAVALALQERRGSQSVELVGASRGLEARSPLTGDLPLTLLPGRGIVRRFDRASAWRNAGALAGLVLAMVRAAVIVARRRPAVVLSVGGYASVPTAIAAVALGVPVVVCNVDAVPGLANRLVGRLARAAAVAVPGTGLPRAVLTGAPVRPDVVAIAGNGVGGPSMQARRRLEIPLDRLVVVVVGGSLGARRLNEAALDLAVRWDSRDDVAIYHVVGRRDAPWAAGQLASPASRAGLSAPGPDGVRSAPAPANAAPANAAPAPGGLWYRQVAYEDRMALVYQAADVIVGRAGAMTVAELAVVGVPAVLVPLPGAPGDHQTANARVLASVGAAEIVPDGACSGARLGEVLCPILADQARRQAMAEAAASCGRPDAADAVATVVEAYARARGGSR